MSMKDWLIAENIGYDIAEYFTEDDFQALVSRIAAREKRPAEYKFGLFENVLYLNAALFGLYDVAAVSEFLGKLLGNNKLIRDFNIRDCQGE